MKGHGIDLQFLLYRHCDIKIKILGKGSLGYGQERAWRETGEAGEEGRVR